MLKSEDRKYLCLLFGLVLGLFVPNLVFQLPVLNLPYMADLAYQWHPYQHFFRDSYLSGHFPLWNPYDLCGIPFLAFSNTSSLYPFSFFYILPFPIATSISILFHLLVTAFATYRLFRELGRNPSVSFIAALSWALSGEFFHHLNHITTLHTLTWIPLFFLATVKLSRELRLNYCLLFLASFSLIFLAGDSETIIYILVLWVWWVLVFPVLRRRTLFFLLLSSLSLLGFLLVSVSFLPLAELFHHSLRGQSLFAPASKSPIWIILLAPIYALLSLFLPIPTPTNIFVPATSSFPFYYGFLIFLGFWAGFRGKQGFFTRRLVIFYGFLFMYGLFFAFPYLRNFLSPFPFFGKLLNFAKMLPALNLVFLVISSQGLDRWIKEGFSGLERTARYFFPVYGVLVLASSFLLKPAMLARILFGASLLLFPFWMRWFKLKPVRWLILLAVLDIYGLAFFYFPRNSYEKFKLHSEMVSSLANTELRGRYLVFSPFLFREVDLPFSAGMIIKAETLDSWMRAPLWFYARFMSLPFPQTLPSENGKIIFYDLIRFRDLNQLSPARLDFLDLVNLRWVISRLPVPLFESQSQYKLLVSKLNFYMYENQNPLPRAKIFHQSINASSDEEGFELLSQKAFDFRKQLLIMSESAPLVNQAEPLLSEPVRLFRPSPDQLLITFTARAPGYLFLSENYYPGWNAELDGTTARIFRADYTFRAVYVESGWHSLRFYYGPVSFRIGLWASLATALNFLLLSAFLIFRQSRKK